MYNQQVLDSTYRSITSANPEKVPGLPSSFKINKLWSAGFVQKDYFWHNLAPNVLLRLIGDFVTPVFPHPSPVPEGEGDRSGCNQ